MAWPVGQKNGNSYYRDIRAAETECPIGTVIPNNTSKSIIIPWGSMGYRQGKMTLQFSTPGACAANSLRILCTPRDSDQGAMIGSVDIVRPLTPGNGGASLVMAWDDSPLPGSYYFLAALAATFEQAAMSQNPVWSQSMADHFIFGIFNSNSGQPWTITALSWTLRG